MGAQWNKYVHKRVWYRHRSNDHDVHKKWYHDNLLVEANKLVVLGEAVVDEILLDSLQEIPVQRCIDKKVKTFLDSVPVLIDKMIPDALLVHCMVYLSALSTTVSLPRLLCRLSSDKHLSHLNHSYNALSENATYVELICNRAGIQMLNTLMLMAVTKTAVVIMIHLDRFRSGTMTRIRLMIICNRSWTWIHHQKRIVK